MAPRWWVGGERASTGAGGFNPSFQRHRAAYRLVAPLLPDGPLLDLGCGMGHSFSELAPRPTIGLDIFRGALVHQQRPTVTADIRVIPFASGSFDAILSSHSVEHVPDPERVVAETARVLRDGGTTVFVTPNRLTFAKPDEVIDPYHFLELDPAELRDLARRSYDDVTVLGVFGTPRYAALVDEEHATLDRLLRLDRWRLRQRVPTRVKAVGYDTLLSWKRRTATPAQAAITIDDFLLGEDDLDAAFDLIAVCRRPRA